MATTAAAGQGNTDTGLKPAGETEVKPAAEVKAGETKPAEVKPAAEVKPDAAAAAGKVEDKAGDQTPKVPDTYTLTVPDDGKAFIDDSDVARIAQVAKANQWTNEEAQAQVADEIAARRGAHERLLTEAKAHPVIGGDKFERAVTLANKALDRFVPKESPDGKRLRSDLARLGLSNYAPLIVAWSNVGAAMGEDSPTGGGQGGGKERTAEEILYPAMAGKS